MLFGARQQCSGGGWILLKRKRIVVERGDDKVQGELERMISECGFADLWERRSDDEVL